MFVNNACVGIEGRLGARIASLVVGAEGGKTHAPTGARRLGHSPQNESVSIAHQPECALTDRDHSVELIVERHLPSVDLEESCADAGGPSRIGGDLEKAR